MKPIKHKDLIKKLKKLGVEFVRNGKGSHMIYRLGDNSASIPNHKTVSPGTQRDIYKCLGIEY